VLTLNGGKLTVASYRLHPIDDTVAGDRTIADEIDKLKKTVTNAVFASRGYRIDQPLAVARRDIPNTFTDIAASTLLANLCTDAFRKATQADIGFTANGMMRASLMRGKSGVQMVYDVFAVAPLGAGVVDSTAGSALVTGYFTGLELKHLLEFFLVDSPAHPGEYFPRASGMRFRYDPARPKFDVVTAIELGDLDRGYSPIDISGKDARLYSLTCPLYLGVTYQSTRRASWLLYPKTRRVSRSHRASRRSTTLATTIHPTCCRRRAQWTKAASPRERGKTLCGRSRSGRRSWIISAACRSGARKNYP
jgi:5'-nucleotidase